MRDIPTTSRASEAVRMMDGLRVPGGCRDCNATQEVHADGFGPDMPLVTVTHEDGCPRLRELEEG